MKPEMLFTEWTVKFANKLHVYYIITQNIYDGIENGYMNVYPISYYLGHPAAPLCTSSIGHVLDDH